MLIWLAQVSVEKEQLDPSKTATQTLMKHLSRLTLSSTGDFGAASDGIRSTSLGYLTWITAVQSYQNGTELRLNALQSGETIFPGIDVAGKFVYNFLKESLDSTLLVADRGPFKYIQSESQTTVIQEEDGVNVAIGFSVVAGLCVVATVVIMTAFSCRRRRLQQRNIVLKEKETSFAEPDVIDGSYFDYLEEDSIIAMRGGFSAYTEQEESSTTETVSNSEDLTDL